VIFKIELAWLFHRPNLVLEIILWHGPREGVHSQLRKTLSTVEIRAISDRPILDFLQAYTIIQDFNLFDKVLIEYMVNSLDWRGWKDHVSLCAVRLDV
jgi:hypothetical protein